MRCRSRPPCSPATSRSAAQFSARRLSSYLLPVRGLLVDDPAIGTTSLPRFAACLMWSSVSTPTHAGTKPPRCSILKDRNLRKWLTSGFFEHHLKCHSKSRRKAPIVWQPATPSSSYSVWLYAHRLTNDSFFQVQNDLVGQKLVHEERKLLALVQTTGANATASQRKEIAAQEILVEELRAMLDEVKRIAPLWKPDPRRRRRTHDGAAMAPRVATAQAVAEGTENCLGCALRRQVRLGASRNASLARTRRSEVHDRPEPGYRPRARRHLSFGRKSPTVMDSAVKSDAPRVEELVREPARQPSR